MKILVIAAHPDDEVLGCGGTMARMVAEGHHVHVVILGEGVTSRFANREDAEGAQLAKLQAEGRNALAVLGCNLLSMEGLPDNRFDTVPILEIVKRLESVLAKLQPDVVYTQHGGDLNIDHQMTFQATLTAVRPVPNHGVRAVYAYEVPSSTEWAFQKFAPVFQPNTYVDISKTLGKKIEAMMCYSSELRKFPHPRSTEAIQALARWRGATVGVEAAEAFQCIWAVQ